MQSWHTLFTDAIEIRFFFNAGTLNNTILKQIGEHTQVSLDSFQIIQAKGTQNVYHSGTEGLIILARSILLSSMHVSDK